MAKFPSFQTGLVAQAFSLPTLTHFNLLMIKLAFCEFLLAAVGDGVKTNVEQFFLLFKKKSTIFKQIQLLKSGFSQGQPCQSEILCFLQKN